ncbi:metal-sulfur cluster assembly factor [Cytobacillus sp. S13-E01]|uniref:metal-sulfur cluster assembly factor n=1 Tax=Cytobacillus sp. S13-E01 TaxID=3031326 RepID=UPI0023D81AC7|nr:metal-sulfur cluster assembly factor [Cytobacillus sp. S13-E01]MDF0726995.1 metal-sulfur cluster assembly factor [Cytobacillus sp. S13-E01]
MTTVEKIYDELKCVIDPELNINVVDLGLIYEVNETNGDVVIKMTLTTPGCPLHDSIVSGVKYAVSEVKEVNSIDVEVVWAPAWSPDRMSEEAKKQLSGY